MRKKRARAGIGKPRAVPAATDGRKAGPVTELTMVCRCEDVTEDEIRQVIAQGYDSLEAIKRVLRTGMGHCQGRGCLRAIARMIEQETGRPATDQEWPRSRPPLKPLPLGMLGASGEFEPQRHRDGQKESSGRNANCKLQNAKCKIGGQEKEPQRYRDGQEGDSSHKPKAKAQKAIPADKKKRTRRAGGQRSGGLG